MALVDPAPVRLLFSSQIWRDAGANRRRGAETDLNRSDGISTIKPLAPSPAALRRRARLHACLLQRGLRDRRFARRNAPSRCLRPIGRSARSWRSPCATRARCRSTRYQAKLAQFLRNYCHRDEASGWKRDKHVRDTGPFIGTLKNGKWTGTYFGTHAPVVTWYSPDMVEWLKSNRARRACRPARRAAGSRRRDHGQGDVPAAGGRLRRASIRCIWRRPSGAAVMVRDAGGSHDGWFWGWFGWGENDWRPDWPAPAANDYPYMGFGLYCTNCHASARDNSTFASLRNIKGEPGDPLVFLSQTFVARAAVRKLSRDARTSRSPTTKPPPDPPYPSRVHALLPAPEQSAADEPRPSSKCRRKPMTMSGRRPASRTPDRKW